MARLEKSESGGHSGADERIIHLSGGPITYQVRPSARARRVRLVVRPGGALEVVKPRGCQPGAHRGDAAPV